MKKKKIRIVVIIVIIIIFLYYIYSFISGIIYKNKMKEISQYTSSQMINYTLKYRNIELQLYYTTFCLFYIV